MAEKQKVAEEAQSRGHRVVLAQVLAREDGKRAEVEPADGADVAALY